MKKQPGSFSVLMVIFLFLWSGTLNAAYVCPRDLSSYDTPEECAAFCPGVDCIESGTYVCSEDVNGDGYIDENEYANCVFNYHCPLEGGSTCDENNQCVVHTDPDCPAGSTLNPDRDVCEATPGITCPPEYSFDSNLDVCVASPICPGGGGYVAERTRCEVPYSPDCPSGWSYVSERNRCERGITCPFPGSYDAAADLCLADVTVTCPSGYTYNSSTGRCEASPQCPSGSVYSPLRDRCEIGADEQTVWHCQGYVHWHYWSDDNWTDSHFSAPPGGRSNEVSYLTKTDWFQFDYQCVITGARRGCFISAGPIPPGSSRNDPCSNDAGRGEAILYNTSYSSTVYSCPSGWNLDSSLGLCYQSPTCPGGGSFDPGADICYTSIVQECPSGYSYDGSLDSCILNPDCSPGALDGNLDVCFTSFTHSCPDGYTYDSESDICYAAPVCPAGGTFQASSGTCTADATINCPADMAYSPDSNLCEAIPVCGQGTYKPDIDQCELVADCQGQWECPIPGASANTCVDLGDVNNYEDDPTDLSYYQDDGQYDENGQCLGQIYIFSGRPMKCRPPGLQTGFHNCCDADDDIVDAVGNQLNLMKGTLALVKYSRKLYEAAKIASTAMQAYDLFHAGYHFEVFDKFPEYYEIVQSATSATDAARKALASMMGISPSSVLGSLALSVAMDFVMDALFGGCSERDVITAAYKENGLCHYVGKKCVKKIPLIGCVQKARIYCCFNSVLARIIHEQGRPQLDTFGPDGGWGTADEPYCRGFRPEEFQMIDFSRIDFSEYVTQYSDTLLNRMPKNTDLEQKMKTKVQDFFGSP